MDKYNLDYINRITIADYKESSNLYGLMVKKKKLVGVNVAKKDIKFEKHVCKADGVERDTALISFYSEKLKTYKKTRFLVTDLKIERKLMPVDRNIKNESEVYVINDKFTRAEKNKKYIVKKIELHPTNKHLDLITINDGNSNFLIPRKNLAIKVK